MIRHTSNNNVYPFVPGTVSPLLDPLVLGLLDVFIVIQGAETGTGSAVTIPEVKVVGTNTSANDLILSLRATEIDGRYWDFDVTIPSANSPGTISSTSISSNADIKVSLFYDTSYTIEAFVNEIAEAQIETSRVVWKTEKLNSISFSNIARCNSTEDAGDIVETFTYDLNAVSPEINIIDGYNTEWSYTDNTLTLVGQAGIGQGNSPDYGNTEGSSCPVIDTAELEGVYTINGLLPVNGNIDLLTSSALYLNKSTGKIEVSKRLETE